MYSMEERQVSADGVTRPVIAIRLTDDSEIQTLNRDHRGKDWPTNVLSFPMFEQEEIGALADSPMPEILLGDIVLARGVCETEAAEKGIALEAHVSHLIVHGLRVFPSARGSRRVRFRCLPVSHSPPRFPATSL